MVGQKCTVSVPSTKTVTWKSILAMPFRTPQECVGNNMNSAREKVRDRCLGKTKYPREHIRVINRYSTTSWRGKE